MVQTLFCAGASETGARASAPAGKVEHDAVAAHIFVSRRAYRNMSDTKSGKRHVPIDGKFKWPSGRRIKTVSVLTHRKPSLAALPSLCSLVASLLAGNSLASTGRGMSARIRRNTVSITDALMPTKGDL